MASTRSDHMDYAAASYFDGYYFQHIAAWCEHLRLRGLTRRLERAR